MMKLLARVVDRDYYLARYPDVARAGIDPVRHFMLYGWREGKTPSERYEIHHDSRDIPLAAHLLDAIHTRRLLEAATVDRYSVFEAARRGMPRLVHRLARKAGQSHRFVHVLHRTTPVQAASAFEEVEPAKPYAFHEPRVFGEPPPRELRTVEVPAKWIATIEHATLIGAFQVVQGKRLVCYEPAADPDLGFVAGTWQYLAKIAGTRDVVTWFEHEHEDTLAEGILFSGRCSPNYFHWLVEYLGRASILSRRPDLQKVPLIVDADMFPQEFESLQAVLPGWPVYRLKKSTLLKVGRLHIPSLATYHPDAVEIPFWQGAGVCVDTLAFLRTRILQHYGITPTAPWRKVFVARRAGRNIANTDEVEQVMVENGFEVVDTATLDLGQQVRLFSEAKVIAGGMGAAFTNLIFCSPGARVLALSSPYTKRFCMQANLAAFAGCSYLVLSGSHPSYREDGERDINAVMDSFSIDIGELRAALAEVQRES